MTEDNIEALKSQLAIARNEINKLRQQVKNLTFVQRKDIEGLKQILKDYRCEGCKQSEENAKNKNNPNKVESENTDNRSINFRPIGVVRTSFPGKRAVPRQSTIGNRLKGAIELNSDVFTNPEHSLEGLEGFSHLWIIYHFHKNVSHPKAKVAPPRLGGERIGVFSTRSPHRPCPIGLSLVEIERIDKSIIYFYGTDMVDGTPVLDIKPYIPLYDTPKVTESGHLSSAGACGDTSISIDFYDSRQEPDGEESGELGAAAVVLNPSSSASYSKKASGSTLQHTSNNHHSQHQQHHSHPLHQYQQNVSEAAVSVPNWIESDNLFKVIFNERAEKQLDELDVDKECIIDILEADPRSVYLRSKYGCQIFTFQLGEVIVTCKFDDKNSIVTVVQVRRAENLQDENTEKKN